MKQKLTKDGLFAMVKEALICTTFFNKLTLKHIQDIYDTAYIKSFNYQKILLNFAPRLSRQGQFWVFPFRIF
ncbi:hypothetical protein AKG34_11265 [Peribacillus butanolivorans]|nr:hypothetical protein AKG34_11265 [Peribacillus butanolivorans]